MAGKRKSQQSNERNGNSTDVSEPETKKLATSTNTTGLPSVQSTANKNSENGSTDPTTSATATETAADPTLLEHAKSRLSKWAARLFDPNRPRGLVQSPEIIPLNDEFLKAFGQREQASYGHLLVETMENDEDNNDATTKDDMEPEETADKKTPSKQKPTKIKCTNLYFQTDSAKLQDACEVYGPLLDVHMVMNKEKPHLNAGRAYVTFQLEDDALECIDNLKELDGRQLRLSLANDKGKSSSDGTANGSGGGNSNNNNNNSNATKNTTQSLLNRFLEKDISTVCYKCGKVGHMEAGCTNPPKPKPCFLCGRVDHEDRDCSFRVICFNCGCPGHVSRDCREPRGSIPRRMVCSLCFESGHHRFSCRAPRQFLSPSSQAICMQCGQLGHFMCGNMQWFFSLKGISCFNCGSQEHLGYDCDRPNVYMCRDDPNLAQREIDRAEAESVYVPSLVSPGYGSESLCECLSNHLFSVLPTAIQCGTIATTIARATKGAKQGV